MGEGEKFTTNTKIWRPVLQAYREVCRKNRITVSDLISLILYHATMDIPLIAYILCREFEIPFENALKLAGELRNRMVKIGEELGEEEEEEVF